MPKNDKTLSSLADLAALVNGPGGRKSPKQAKGEAADFRSPPVRRDDFVEIEAEMRAKAKASATAPPTSDRLVMEVQQTGRNKSKVVETTRLTHEQVAADVAAYKSTQHIRDARDAEKREREERLTQEAA